MWWHSLDWISFFYGKRADVKELTNDEKAGKGNHDISSHGCLARVGLVKGKVTNRSPDHEANEHPRTTNDEGLATTKVLDNVQTREGHAKVDSTENDLGDVAVETNRREDGVSEIEDKVGTGQLLQRLEDNPQHGAVEHAGSGEDFMPGSLASTLLLFELLLHVFHLLGDAAVVTHDTIQLAHDLAGFLEAAVAVGKPGRFRQEEGTDTQDERPGKANTHGDAPGGSGGDGVGTVVDDIGDEDTKGDEKLEGTNHGTPNLSGGGFTLVHGDDAGQSTDAQTGDQTAHGNLVPLGSCGYLDDDADDVDEGPEGDGQFPAETVCYGSSHQGANHSTNREL